MTTPSGQSKWRGFSDVILTEQAREAVKALEWDDNTAAAYIVELAQSGYRVTVSWSEKNHCFVISATGTEGENAGLTMTQRHADFAIAVCAHFFAHTQLTEGQWPIPTSKNGSIDW